MEVLRMDVYILCCISLGCDLVKGLEGNEIVVRTAGSDWEHGRGRGSVVVKDVGNLSALGGKSSIE